MSRFHSPAAWVRQCVCAASPRVSVLRSWMVWRMYSSMSGVGAWYISVNRRAPMSSCRSWAMRRRSSPRPCSTASSRCQVSAGVDVGSGAGAGEGCAAPGAGHSQRRETRCPVSAPNMARASAHTGGAIEAAGRPTRSEKVANSTQPASSRPSARIRVHRVHRAGRSPHSRRMAQGGRGWADMD